MKIILPFLLLLVLPIKWEPDFENAKKTAKEKHELILLNFSGSDWCGPCIALRKDYFENDTFTKMADENLVLVNADFPRRKKNMASAEVTKRNEALADTYNKDGDFPLTLLLDSDGKVLKKWRGRPDAPVEKWASEIAFTCQSKK